MADFYYDLDLDIEGYDPDDPSDPINALLEKIREAQADKSPKAYVLNEKNLKRFMYIYAYFDKLAEEFCGKTVDIVANPTDVHFSVSIEVLDIALGPAEITDFKKYIFLADTFGFYPTTNNTVIITVGVNYVYDSIKLDS